MVMKHPLQLRIKFGKRKELVLPVTEKGDSVLLKDRPLRQNGTGGDRVVVLTARKFTQGETKLIGAEVSLHTRQNTILRGDKDDMIQFDEDSTYLYTDLKAPGRDKKTLTVHVPSRPFRARVKLERKGK